MRLGGECFTWTGKRRVGVSTRWLAWSRHCVQPTREREVRQVRQTEVLSHISSSGRKLYTFNPVFG